MKHLQPTSSTLSDTPNTFAILRDERLAQLHDAFLRSQLNDHTRETYANGIDAFLRFTAVAGLTDFLDVEPAHIVEFTRSMAWPQQSCPKRHAR